MVGHFRQVIRTMLILTQLPYCWSVVLVVVGSVELAQFEKTVKASAAIHVGTDDSTVRSILGEPLARWEARSPLSSLFLGPRPRQWVYGTWIDLQRIIMPEFPFLNPIPIRLRLFDADENDLVIHWNDADVVERIQQPSPLYQSQRSRRFLIALSRALRSQYDQLYPIHREQTMMLFASRRRLDQQVL